MASWRSPGLGSQVGPRWPPRPLRNRPRAALGELLGALEAVFGRSWRVLGPSWAFREVGFREVILEGYFGGREAGQSMNFC